MAITDQFCIDLIGKGFFPRTAVPIFSSNAFANWIATQNVDEKQTHYPDWTELAFHSTPKDSRTRRIHATPNPSSYTRLCISIARHWAEINLIFDKSTISTSRPVMSSSEGRAIKYFDQNAFLEKRILEGAGKRWYLRTDLAAFYPSVYLHAIEWAIDGRPDLIGGRKQNGIGGKFDRFSRSLQGTRSIGLPVGPDTSAIISEIIVGKIDDALSGANCIAVRHVDDIYVYSESRDGAEAALSVLSKVCSDYMLELNGRKTLIEQMVDPFDAQWKFLTDRHDGDMELNTPKRLVSFFDGAFQLAREHCDDSVLKYMTKVSWKAIQNHQPLWPRYIPFLLHAITCDSRSVDVVASIFYEMHQLGTLHCQSQIFEVFSSFIRRHALLQNGFEVSWGLWCLRSLDLFPQYPLASEVVLTIVGMNDDMPVTQLALYATQGLIAVPNQGEWNSRALVAHSCSNTHWLFAYEAKLRGWGGAKIDGTEPQILSSALQAGISFLDETKLNSHLPGYGPDRWSLFFLQRRRNSGTLALIDDASTLSDEY